MIRFVVALMIMISGSFLMDHAYGTEDYNVLAKICALMLYGFGFIILTERKAI